MPAGDDAQPPLSHKTDKNFLRDNAYNTITAVPKKPVAAYIDSVHGTGNRFALAESGLVPKYSGKKDYGRVPEYLTQRHEVSAHVACMHALTSTRRSWQRRTPSSASTMHT